MQRHRSTTTAPNHSLKDTAPPPQRPTIRSKTLFQHHSTQPFAQRHRSITAAPNHSPMQRHRSTSHPEHPTSTMSSTSPHTQSTPHLRALCLTPRAPHQHHVLCTLCATILYTLLYHLMFFIILYIYTPYHILLCSSIYYTILYHILLYHIILYYIILYYIALK